MDRAKHKPVLACPQAALPPRVPLAFHCGWAPGGSPRWVNGSPESAPRRSLYWQGSL